MYFVSYFVFAYLSHCIFINSFKVIIMLTVHQGIILKSVACNLPNQTKNIQSFEVETPNDADLNSMSQPSQIPKSELTKKKCCQGAV